jgi:hypothetical protein
MHLEPLPFCSQGERLSVREEKVELVYEEEDFSTSEWHVVAFLVLSAAPPLVAAASPRMVLHPSGPERSEL